MVTFIIFLSMHHQIAPCIQSLILVLLGRDARGKNPLLGSCELRLGYFLLNFVGLVLYGIHSEVVRLHLLVYLVMITICRVNNLNLFLLSLLSCGESLHHLISLCLEQYLFVILILRLL